MVIDDTIFDKLVVAIKVGLITLENTKTYYDIINDRATADFIYKNQAAPSHFRFLKEVLDSPILAKCPVCGHYNDNIECPVIYCEYCSHEFKIHTDSSDDVCNECVAHKTKNCDKIPDKMLF